jgi:hypothetical protein
MHRVYWDGNGNFFTMDDGSRLFPSIDVMQRLPYGVPLQIGIHFQSN